MIDRKRNNELLERLDSVPVVALLGSRQVGKTTLARALHHGKPMVYLDLERPSDLAKLAEPELFLGQYSNTLVIIDEIQRQPELFPLLRSLVDERRRAGEAAGHFLLLGSASAALLKQSSETLAGRISYLELAPLVLTEVGVENIERHWLRGGYPDSYLAHTNQQATRWCADFVTSYVERYLPDRGVAASAIELRRLCMMLAHLQSTAVNYSQIGGSLGLDAKTVRRYVDLLEGLFLIRQLRPWSKNVGKRLVKSARVHWRDTGIVHTLLGISEYEQLLGHPICGHSWESYCIEQILEHVPHGVIASYYRTQAGAEIDLVLEYASGKTIAVEIKRTLSPKITPSFVESMTTIGATCGVFIMPQGSSFPMAQSVTAYSLAEFLEIL
jgi:predicted AAA+ superfamily ATPase